LFKSFEGFTRVSPALGFSRPTPPQCSHVISDAAQLMFDLSRRFSVRRFHSSRMLLLSPNPQTHFPIRAWEVRRHDLQTACVVFFSFFVVVAAQLPPPT